MKERIQVLGKPDLINLPPRGVSYCPGCHQPLIFRILSEIINDFGIREKILGTSGIGCSVIAYRMLQIDWIQCLHGRACDTAAGAKRVYNKKRLVFTLQGDGDCMSIGTEGVIHAAARNENITVIMMNNAGYGMTGGQLSPTTLIDQVTATSPEGRDPEVQGYPLHAAELIAGIRGTVYSARGSLHKPKYYQKTKKYIAAALQKQRENKGFGFVEVLCACPTVWKLSPIDSLKWIEEKLIKEFSLGEFKT